MRITPNISEYISLSLDRTNNIEYVTYLKNEGFTFYPIVDEDYIWRYSNISHYLNSTSSEFANKQIVEIGVLEENNILEENVEIKSEKSMLSDEQKIYMLKNLYNEGVITESEIKEKLFLVVNKTKK